MDFWRAVREADVARVSSTERTSSRPAAINAAVQCRDCSAPQGARRSYIRIGPRDTYASSLNGERKRRRPGPKTPVGPGRREGAALGAVKAGWAVHARDTRTTLLDATRRADEGR